MPTLLSAGESGRPPYPEGSRLDRCSMSAVDAKKDEEDGCFAARSSIEGKRGDVVVGRSGGGGCDNEEDRKKV